VRPLLKWAGGKRQLLPAFRRFYPREFCSYFEPFVGSGAVFFDLHAAKALDGRRVVLTDSNRDLVGCYRLVRDDPAGVVAALERLAHGHAADGQRHYYAVRDEFNRLRGYLPKAVAYTPALAAMLIYLNRTGFNGLFRLNGDGRFNVPAGRYVRPRIFDPDHVFAISRVLARRGVSIALAAFDAVLKKARAGDFLYFDPPYAPLSPTARFTSYTAEPFTLADHRRLRDVATTLAGRGCHVMVSNSSAPEIASLYEEERSVAASGLRLYRLPARRAINSRGDGRGAITELLLTNLEPHD
jgi:DNA adenine methylase